ncbi:hypothetical protein ACFQ9J_15865 [Streptomyces sp. NPDC056529]|uniref:hypothetical protein n=1 Tax=Streptomyces sp. NPDC056529 TaxID=3345855 RepID=UPI00367C151E
MGEDVAALRAELERERREHAEARHQAALAAAEAGHLRTQLAAKEDHIEDLRTALRALAPAPERAAIEQNGHQADGVGVVVPGQAAPKRPVPAGTESEPEPTQVLAQLSCSSDRALRVTEAYALVTRAEFDPITPGYGADPQNEGSRHAQQVAVEGRSRLSACRAGGRAADDG